MARHFATLDGFPETAKWYDRLTERAAYQAALPEESGAQIYEQAFYAAPEEDADG